MGRANKGAPIKELEDGDRGKLLQRGWRNGIIKRQQLKETNVEE